MDPYREYTVPRQRGLFASRRRQVPVSRHAQDWTRSLEAASGGHRRVIDRKASVLPAFSAEGIRWDVMIVILSLLLLLIAGVLVSDIEALRAGSSRIGKLSAGIESLEGSNAILEDEISMVMKHPVLKRMNELAEAEEETETVITISAAPRP